MNKGLSPAKANTRTLLEPDLSEIPRSGPADRVGRNSLHALMVRILGTGVTLGLYVILARAMTAAQFGVYTYATSWIPLLAAVSTLGLHLVAVRFVAAYHASGQWGLLRGLLGRTALLVLLGGVAAGSILATVTLVVRTQLDTSLVWALLLVAMSLPIMTEIHLLMSILAGLGYILESQSLNIIVRPLGLAGIVGFLWWLGAWELTAPRTTLLHFGVAVGVLLLAVTWVVRRLPRPVLRF